MSSPTSSGSPYALADVYQLASISGNVRTLCSNFQYLQNSISRLSESILIIKESIDIFDNRLVKLEEKVEYIYNRTYSDELIHIHHKKDGNKSILMSSNIVSRRKINNNSFPLEKNIDNLKTLKTLHTIDKDVLGEIDKLNKEKKEEESYSFWNKFKLW